MVNYFRFQAKNKDNKIFIYSVDFGILEETSSISTRINSRIEAIKSIASNLEKVLKVFITYGKTLYSLTLVE